MVHILTVYLDFDHFMPPPPPLSLLKITPGTLSRLKIARQGCRTTGAFPRVPLVEVLKTLTQTSLLDLGTASRRGGDEGQERVEKRKRIGERPWWGNRERIEEVAERRKCEGRESHPPWPLSTNRFATAGSNLVVRVFFVSHRASDLTVIF